MRRFQSIKAVGLMTLVAAGFGIFAWGMAQPDMPAYPDLKTAGAVSRVMQQVSGFTPLSGWVANRLLRREISHYVQGHLHSRLSLFSGTDLLDGKARSITLSGKNLLLDGYIPLTEFTFVSQPDMPIMASRTSRPVLLRPVVFQMGMTLSEDDINRMLGSEKGQRLLTDMKAKLPPFGLQSFDAIKPTVRLDGGRVNIHALMNLHDAPLSNALPMTVSGNVVPDKSSLALSGLDLQIEGVQDTRDIAQVVEHYFNELVDLNHIKVQRHRLKVQITQVAIHNRQLNLTATLTVSPESKALKAALAAHAT